MAPKAAKKSVLNSTPVSPVHINVNVEEDAINTEAVLTERYKKMTQIEHILKLPDTYIGSTAQSDPIEMWVWDGTAMEKRFISYIPGLFKIFDEIIVNVYDHWVRCRSNVGVPQVKEVSVIIDEDGVITVRNDGAGIDVEIHPEYSLWIPEMIFGHLLTSANYEQKGKTTGGKNGLGSKCTNIYSKKFSVTTVDHVRKRKFTQEFRNNMSERDIPLIEEKCLEKPYTSIKFSPDYERFNGMHTLDVDHRALFEKRVVDLTACMDKTVTILLNGKKVDCKTLERYVDLYLGNKTETKRVYEYVDERWEIVAAMSLTEQFEHVSFVNGVNTSKGGRHVEYLSQMICTKLVKASEKKASKKNVDLKPAAIREQLWLFARTVIEDPSFDSQTKDFLTTPHTAFGSRCILSDQFIEKLVKTGICDKAIALAEFKTSYALQKTDGKKKNTLRGIPKLDDANWAGTANSRECTLILTEGDSAKAFAVAGLSIVGRDKYGVFPLRGKMLNVRDATVRQVVDNAEINSVKQILGLRQGVKYNTDNITELRYGHVMLLTDADVDGSHIRGLLINFFHTFWPSLLEVAGFLQTMVTPIVKAFRRNELKVFYSWMEYKDWKDKNHNSGWKIKYYKGLGTSDSKEAKEYFTELSSSLVNYCWTDSETVNNALLLAFSKNMTDDRKTWLEKYDSKAIIDGCQREIKFEEFIHKDLIHFSNYDCERSVPSLIDGLKPSQRKVVHAVFMRNLTESLKVAQLAAYVAEKTAYHHGEQSLNGAIIGMAQDFVGSNNFPILMPEGQFGTRLQGGKDHASQRYIFTRMNPLLPKLFPENDRPLLTYLDDDGITIEPVYFVPILPLILINGAEGIGTGFSCRIPTYHPRDIVENLKRLINGEEMRPIRPWVRGFRGTMEENTKEPNKWTSKGVFRWISSNQIEITELPVGRWTEDYKEQLEDWILNKKDMGITDYESHYTDTNVRFIIKFSSGVVKRWIEDGGEDEIEKKLRLIDGKRFLTTNMHLFNAHGQIHKYVSPLNIIEEFYPIRLEMYEKRKRHMLLQLERNIAFLKERVRFLVGIIEGKLEISRRSSDDIERDLLKMEFHKANKDTTTNNNGWILYPPMGKIGSWEYLLGMSIRSLTKEKIHELEEEMKKEEVRFDELNCKTIQKIWTDELDDFLSGYVIQTRNWEKETFDRVVKKR